MQKEPLRLVDGSGRPIDPAVDEDAGYQLAHQLTFASLFRNMADAYHWKRDEAIRASREAALAMPRDAFITAVMNERKLQLTKLKGHCKAEDQKSAVQKPVAKAMDDIVKRTYRWRQYLWQLSGALWYGNYANQNKIESTTINGAKRMAVVGHRPMNGDKIQWGYDGTPKVMVHQAALQALQDKGKVKKEDIQWGGLAPTLALRDPKWRKRFVIHKHNCVDADYFEGEMAGGVHGVGIRSEIYWNYFLRDEMLGWAINHLKKIGVGGILVFYYDEGNNSSKNAAENAAQQAGERYAIAMPRPRGSAKDTNHAELLSFNESGVTALTSIIQDYFERHMERLIIGQTLSANAGPTGLGSGLAELHQSTRFSILEFVGV